MAEALTYDSLVSDIKLYAERTDTPFISQVPRFIMMAENRLAIEIKSLGFIRVAQFTLENTNDTYVKPARWRKTKSLSVFINGREKHLFSRGLNYCKSYWPTSSLTDEPEYYADYDHEHFLIVPTPDSAYPAQITYFERPEPLSDSNQTNWITQYCPQLLIYACLLEAQPFLKNAERAAEFQAMYDRTKETLQMEEISRMSDASSNRSNG